MSGNKPAYQQQKGASWLTPYLNEAQLYKTKKSAQEEIDELVANGFLIITEVNEREIFKDKLKNPKETATNKGKRIIRGKRH